MTGNCRCYFLRRGGPNVHMFIVLQIQNQYLVEGKDIVVKYSLYNVGDAAAVGVKLAETGFPSDAFDMVGGAMKVSQRSETQTLLNLRLPIGPGD